MCSSTKKIGIVFQIVSLRWVRYSLCDRRLEEVGARKKRLLHRLGAICLPLYFKLLKTESLDNAILAF